MSVSYFRRKAAESYRRARSSLSPHLDYEALIRLGHQFKGKAAAAVLRLDRLRGVALRRQESKRQDAYRDGRE